MRKIIIITLSLMLMFSIGVYAQENLVTSEQIGDSEAEIELSWAALPYYSLSNPYEDRENVLKDSALRFAKRNPNVRINPQVLTGDISGQMLKLLQQESAGNIPDVAQIDSFYLPIFKDKLEPLNEFLTEEEIDDLVPFAKEGMLDKDGNVKALWFTTDARMLYYRKDLIDTPPSNWDELIEVAKEVTANNNMEGFLFSAGRGEATTISNLPYFWAQGGKLINENGKPVFNEGDNRDYMINVFEYIKRLVDSGVTPRRVTNITLEADINGDVIGNNVAMFIGGNWQINQLAENMGREEFNKKWDIAPIPHINSDLEATAVGGWTWGITTEDPEKKAAAMRFLDEMYFGKEGMKEWTKVGGYLPTRNSIYNEYTYYSDNPWMDKIQAIMENGHVRPGYPIYTNLSTEFQVALADVIDGNKTPEEAVDSMWNNVMAEYEEMN
jgi:multiple sugar transport system substrate-binding protein